MNAAQATECMALRWQCFGDQSLDFDSTDQTLDRSPRKILWSIRFIRLFGFVVGHSVSVASLFLFLLFLLWWKFLFFSFAWIWITDPKPILPLEYISLWDFYAGWIPFIAFILEESLNIYADLFVISLCACCFSRGGRIMIMVLLREVGVCFLSQPP